jgi:hypothetical protein
VHTVLLEIARTQWVRQPEIPRVYTYERQAQSGREELEMLRHSRLEYLSREQ